MDWVCICLHVLQNQDPNAILIRKVSNVKFLYLFFLLLILNKQLLQEISSYSFEVWHGLLQCSPSLTFMLPPAVCSPVAAELNHCEHGRNSLFTCGLSPAAARPGLTSICLWHRVFAFEWEGCVWVWICKWDAQIWVSSMFVRRTLLSSCQPLEIPGNVIQSCSLKNHSARNSPGQQRQGDVWQKEVFKADENTNDT